MKKKYRKSFLKRMKTPGKNTIQKYLDEQFNENPKNCTLKTTCHLVNKFDKGYCVGCLFDKKKGISK